MERFMHDGSPKTPTINFDFDKGLLEIKGPSTPENSIEFYQPLFDKLQEYTNSAQQSTIVNMQMEYFNTSSSKCILNMFKKLENIHRAGNSVTVNWHYESDDQDMLEAGQDYEATINLPFKMVAVPV